MYSRRLFARASRLIKTPRVRRQCLLRGGSGVEHMAAAIDLECCPSFGKRRGKVIEHIFAAAIGGEGIAVAMGNEQPERGDDGKQIAQVAGRTGGGAGFAALTAGPVPAAIDVVRQQAVGHLGLETKLMAGIAGEGGSIGAG